jgi:hypothetical protein
LAPQRQDGSETIFTLRNGSDIIMPFCRLSNTYDSFIPSTIRQWNSLDLSLRNVDSIAKFKAELRKVRPVTILAASSCKWSSLLEFPTSQLSHTS